ncbi:hypothetical protein [Isosphaera pallida]|uniref:hypothetical protein n=1 Tax=Isosphaera pallida TaxID=128 RepID=UPI00143A36B9|nr:hypothetical protein [Isosphaera pallida]
MTNKPAWIQTARNRADFSGEPESHRGMIDRLERVYAPACLQAVAQVLRSDA